MIDPYISLLFGEESLWTYFDNLNKGDLPSLEELFRMALSLYDNYSTPTASTIFMTGCPNSPVVQVGEPWREEEDTELKPVLIGTDDMDTEQGDVRTDLANRPTEPMLVSLRARYMKLWGNRGFLQSGSRQTTPVRVGVTCGSGISVVRVGRE